MVRLGEVSVAQVLALYSRDPLLPDADMSCLGCGKRANKDCKFRRCKNCCNAAMLKCTVHARFIPGLTSKALLEDAPPGGIPAPQLSSIQPQTPSVGEMQSYADMGTLAPRT
jgi:LRP1 type putative zinc finger protein